MMKAPEQLSTSGEPRDSSVTSNILERAGSYSASNSDESSGDENSHNGPSRKRKRPLKISCELCKARKVKCDRAEPSCGWCVRNSRVCIYKERKKPGLRASYGVELEDKLNRIEASLYLIGRRVEDHISNGTCHDGQSNSTFSASQRLELPSLQQLSEPYPQHTPVSQPAWLPPHATSLSQMQYSRPADSMSVQSLVATSDPTRAASELPLSSTPRMSYPEEDDLPPHDLLYSIVDLYFKHVGTWSPILDRKATFDLLFGPQAQVGEAEKVLMHALVAVTLRFCKDSRLNVDSRQRYHDISRRKVQLHALEMPSITAMKALALVVVDALGSSNGPQGWNLLALLARNIVQLGLGSEKSVYLAPAPSSVSTSRHQALCLPQPESWIEDEGRRRLFWLTYILDRYATVATSFDFLLDERETDRSLPCRYDLFSKNEPVETRWPRAPNYTDTNVDNPENLGSFSYHCEVLKILSKIHSFLRTPVDIESVTDVNRWRDTYRDLDSRLNTWLSSLPGEYGKISQLCHSDPGSRVSNWIMIHAAFVTSVIRLHSVAAYPTSVSHLFMSSPTAVQRCLAAVESLRAIAQDVVDTGMLDLLGPPFALSLWVSGRLLLVHSAFMEGEVDPKIWFLIATLETMGVHWDVARNWAGTLGRLVREGQQADEDSRQGRAIASGKTYAEMRRCAHDLATLMTRKPRTVLDPPATRLTSSNELEYLDVFEWFSYPRVPPATVTYYNSVPSKQVKNLAAGLFSSLNPDSDWLNFKQPFDFKPPYDKWPNFSRHALYHHLYMSTILAKVLGHSKVEDDFHQSTAVRMKFSS